MPDQLLVSEAHADGLAAVLVDEEEGDVCLTVDLESPAAALHIVSGYEPTSVASLNGTVQGGVAPAAAVRGTLLTDAGDRVPVRLENGAWLAIVPHPSEAFTANAVLFKDASGEIVERPAPEGWPRTAVLDADEECPACGATNWEEVRGDGQDPALRKSHLHPEDHEHFDLGPQPIAIARCARCGYVEGSVWRSGSDDFETEPNFTEEELAESDVLAVGPSARIVFTGDPADTLDGNTDLGDSRTEALRRATVPLYAVEGLDGWVTSWGGSEEATTSVSIGHGTLQRADGPTVQVQTMRWHDAEDLEVEERTFLCRTLGTVLTEEPPPSRSVAGEFIWERAMERRRRRLIARAEAETKTVQIDGVPKEFVYIEVDGAWAATHRDGDLLVICNGAGVEFETLKIVSLEPSDKALLVAPNISR